MFLQWNDGDPDALGHRLRDYGSATLPLNVITNRGVKVWPNGFPETFCVDHWRCRFKASNDAIAFNDVLDLQARLNAAGFDVVKTENLYTFDGEPGYTSVHG